MSAPKFPERVRNELRFRNLTVLRSVRIAGCFQRLVFGGDDLTGFASLGFDDHIKLFFPQPGSTFAAPTITDDGIIWENDIRPASRDYTPMFDAARNELTLDFYLHQSGVASDWANQARPGDRLTVGGPRGSLVIPEDYHWQLYVCDETGMPALLRRLEALSQSAPPVEVTALISVQDAASKDYFAHLSGFNLEWFIGDRQQAVAQRLAQLTLPEHDYYLWLTGEGKTVKDYSRIFEQQQVDDRLLRAVAYWHSK
ncbi:FMN reductase [Winslowiella iniecta]|uniref:FMN reductase n=1 Tax=Winslowiella iniecta TaxID=1560201 RepID=A0A0L7SYJ7_9GAMM|nr:FMN reductase [Winslowiella iniecta]KOC94285.1 FMN reductase [Winslowiella iniecta]